MSAYFISDLHLNPHQPALTQAFYRFLNTTAAKAQQLYILGDFFDAWLGDDEDNPFALDIQAALRAYIHKGTQVFISQGNRDFLLGQGFAKATGCQLIAEETCLFVQGVNTLLMHGDSLCTGDTAYMAFRQQVRSTEWQTQVLSLPLPQRRLMAQQLRSQSQSLNAMKAADIMDVDTATVAQCLASHGVTQLIHGHTHRPALHRFQLNGQPALRWVLGDWQETGWYIRASGQLALVEFNLSTGETLREILA